MISWWWLVVEFAALVVYGAWVRGCTRTVALRDALDNPTAAHIELLWRLGVASKPLVGPGDREHDGGGEAA